MVGLRLQDRRVLVAGAGAGGLGEAVVRMLLEEGAVVAGLDLDQARLEGTMSGLPDGARCTSRVVDVTDEDAMNATIDSIEEEIGELDGVVHVVGTNLRRWWFPFEQFPMKEFDESLNANLRSAIITGKVLGARLIERPGSSFVFVSSISSFQGMPYALPYAIAKAGVNSLMQTMALELAPFDVRVNAIAPGTFVTIQSPDKEDEVTKNAVPLGRRGTPDDMAGAICFLLSPLANFITGQVLAVDGGCLARPSYVDNSGLPVFIKNMEFRDTLLARRTVTPAG